MIYLFTVNLVVVLHLGFICFVIFGGLLILKWPWVILFHVPAAAWGALIEYQGWLCPLTPLELKLRQAGVNRDIPAVLLNIMSYQSCIQTI